MKGKNPLIDTRIDVKSRLFLGPKRVKVSYKLITRERLHIMNILKEIA